MSDHGFSSKQAMKSGTLPGSTRPSRHSGRSPRATGAARNFEQYDLDFRKDFESGNYSKLGYTYEHVVPAYRYGYHLGTSADFMHRDWATIEAEAGSAWEERNPGTWEQMRAAARHAWDKVTGRR